jgi:hypothetical protein
VTVRLEYLPDGSPDCPLIRLYDFDHRTVGVLRHCVTELRNGARRELAVHDLPDVEAVDGCRLVFEVGMGNLGVIRSGSSNSFRCVLTEAGWENVAHLMEPFCEPVQAGNFQWLSDEGKISLLLSVNGQW